MVIEPERYELFEGPAYHFQLDRREFLGVAGVFLSLASLATAQQPAQQHARLHVADDGTVTVFTGKVEVGQGSRTEIAMAVAEEMRIPLERVKVVMADTNLVPNDGITAGSRTTPSTIPAVRKAAAEARKLLPNNPDSTEITPPKDWKILGTPHYRMDAKAIVTGAHQYPSDIKRPGMLYGCVLRAPSYGAKLLSADLSAATKMNGVVAVQDGTFVACAAPTSFAARQAVEAIAAKAKWENAEHPSSSNLFAYLKAHASKGRRPRTQAKGSLDMAMQQAAQKHKAEYHVPYIQHAPMEPRAAVAEWQDDKLTVWTGTQNPFGVRDQLVQAFHLSPDRVRVITPDTGGGFGGKHSGETAIEAARLAREAKRPVSLRWTRAEEFTWAYFRPAGLFEIEGAVDAEGRITAWDFVNYNAGTAAMESPYNTPNTRTRFVECEAPLRAGSYRGIAATANNFARECFIDELAEIASADPFSFRLKNIDNTRLRDVLTAAAEKFRFAERRKGRATGTGIGIACGTEKGSYVAACAEVETTKTGFRLKEMCMAYECGAILNPANLRNQVEGSIIQGLGGALSEAIAFENGKLTNGRFSKYPVPRFKDVPKIEFVLLDRRDLKSEGAGETPIIAVAPAIANAFFHATGKRARSMPIA